MFVSVMFAQYNAISLLISGLLKKVLGREAYAFFEQVTSLYDHI